MIMATTCCASVFLHLRRIVCSVVLKTKMATKTDVFVVLSGKGGVGKSTVAALLALNLSKTRNVGLIDIDICGPSQAKMMGCQGNEDIMMNEGGKWLPVEIISEKLSIMSMAFLLDNDRSSVTWRGPKKTTMIKQMLTGVDWGENCSTLVIDTPPGTSDEHLTIVETLGNNPAYNVKVLLVSTPQLVALNDLRRQITFCKRSTLQISGMIINMSDFKCEHCANCIELFPKDTIKDKLFCGVRVLSTMELLPTLSHACETGSLKDCFTKFESISAMFDMCIAQITSS